MGGETNVYNYFSLPSPLGLPCFLYPDHGRARHSSFSLSAGRKDL